jgi:hypothetical protein
VAPAADAKKPADAPAAPVSAKPKTLIVEDEPAAGDKPAAEKAPEPPKADWKLEAPKDHALDPADLGALEKSFKGAGLDQAKAQALLNEHAALQKSQVERAYTVWHDQAMKDPEIGGEKMPATLTNVKRAMGLLCTAEERKVIANSAFANNPIFLRVMNRAAALIPQEDGTKIVGAQPVGKQMPSTVAGAVDLMYGHLRK